MKSFAPFLKMYTEYVRNFDNAMTLINQWQAKCPRFAAIMDEIHVSDLLDIFQRLLLVTKLIIIYFIKLEQVLMHSITYLMLICYDVS